jgi:ATP-dependent RNA helicase DeaD
MTNQTLPELTLTDLPQRLQQAAANAGWPQLMPVQAKSMPYLLAGNDLLVQSHTGSGKTGAFILPALERIHPDKKSCQVLILVPTRELAKQVATEASILAGESGIRTIAVYGGASYGPQIAAFEAGAHLVVGTPGRVLDHLLKRNLSLRHLQMLIFDEADRMLSMGFYPDMRAVRGYLPEHHVNTAMFSATFPPRVLRLAHEFLTEPVHLSLSSDHVHVVETEHRFYIVPGMDKDRSLVRIIEVENPESALIFCNTRNKVHYVATVLNRFGYDAAELSSDLSQKARERVLDKVRAGKLRFLVATDVASRGIDIPALSHAILYEPPEDNEDYIHRAGRTGRAGAAGTAISLVNQLEARKLRTIAQRYEINMHEADLPSDEDVAAIVSERATALLEAKLRDRDKLQIERMKRFGPMLQTLIQTEHGQNLLAMLVDDFYHDALHRRAMPQEAQEKAQPRARKSKRRPNRRRPRRRSS